MSATKHLRGAVLAVTQIRSAIRQPPYVRNGLVTLGLTHSIGKTRLHKNLESVRGQIDVVNHLVKVREVVMGDPTPEEIARSPGLLTKMRANSQMVFTEDHLYLRGPTEQEVQDIVETEAPQRSLKKTNMRKRFE